VSAALEARDLYRFYHAGDAETLALRGASLTLERGEIVAVTGPSGSGKSTLLACLAGLDEPDGGTVYVDGERITRRSEEERAQIRARGLGLLFQDDNLVGHLTVAQNVKIAASLAGNRTVPQDAIDDVGLSPRANHLPQQLSGGERARAGLAVAIANRPAVLLADEPTGELDDSTSERILNLLRAQAEAGAAILVVTHDQAVANAAHRRLTITDGVLSE
jgi:putative ABC transport system ATP-binding protein